MKNRWERPAEKTRPAGKILRLNEKVIEKKREEKESGNGKAKVNFVGKQKEGQWEEERRME